jgi:hypothetical protein
MLENFVTSLILPGEICSTKRNGSFLFKPNTP